jgi:hypothetical protein
MNKQQDKNKNKKVINRNLRYLLSVVMTPESKLIGSLMSLLDELSCTIFRDDRDTSTFSVAGYPSSSSLL